MHRRRSLHVAFSPCNLNYVHSKHGSPPGSERPTFVSTVFMIKLQAQKCKILLRYRGELEDMRGTCAVRVIPPKREVVIGLSVYMDEVWNSDGHKPPLSIGI